MQVVKITCTAGIFFLGWMSTGMPRPSSSTLRAVLVKITDTLVAKPARPSSAGIVDHLDQCLVGIDRIGVHPGPVQDRREILKNLDVFGGICAWLLRHCFLVLAVRRPWNGRIRTPGLC
jgi:hypothetical protein